VATARTGSSSQILLGLAAFVVVVAGMRAAQAILVPFLLAGFIALLLAPLLFWLQERGIPSALALLMVLLVLLSGGGVFGGLIGNAITGFTQALPLYQERFQELVTVATNAASARGLELFDGQNTEAFDPKAILGVVGTLAGSLGGILNNALMIFLTVCFMLLEASSVPAKIQEAMANRPGSSPEDMAGRMGEIGEAIRRYLGIKALTSGLTGLIVYFWLLFVGVNLPALCALLAFFLNFVAAIGSILAAIPAVLLALVDGGTSMAALAASGYLAVNVCIGYVLEPRVMGEGMGLSALVVLMSLVFWGFVLGPVGTVLAVPLTVMFRIVLSERPQTHWIAVLLGPAVAPTDADESTEAAAEA